MPDWLLLLLLIAIPIAWMMGIREGMSQGRNQERAEHASESACFERKSNERFEKRLKASQMIAQVTERAEIDEKDYLVLLEALDTIENDGY